MFEVESSLRDGLWRNDMPSDVFLKSVCVAKLDITSVLSSHVEIAV